MTVVTPSMQTPLLHPHALHKDKDLPPLPSSPLSPRAKSTRPTTIAQNIPARHALPLASNPPSTAKLINFSKPKPKRATTAPPRLTKQFSIKRDSGTYTAGVAFAIPMRQTTYRGGVKGKKGKGENQALIGSPTALSPKPEEVAEDLEDDREQESGNLTALPAKKTKDEDQKPHDDDNALNKEMEDLTRELDGDLAVSNSLPSRATLTKCRDLPIFDAEGKEHKFGSLWEDDCQSGDGAKKRVMLIFIRHFFCGNCQEYIRRLSADLPPSSLPSNTTIRIIGCGSSTLIPQYISLTSCPYPIHADPSKRLYSLLGMTKTLSLGKRDPAYIQHSLLTGVWQSVVQGIKRVGEGDVLKAGDMRQVGGEFLLETDERAGKEKFVWCHRMRNTRDHAEIEELKDVLGLSALVLEEKQQDQRGDTSSQHSHSTTGDDDHPRRRRAPSMQRRWTSTATGALRRSISGPRRATSWMANEASRRNRSSSTDSHGSNSKSKRSGSRMRSASDAPSPARVVSLTLKHELDSVGTGRVKTKANHTKQSHEDVGRKEEPRIVAFGAQVIREEPTPVPTPTMPRHEFSDEEDLDEFDEGDSINGTSAAPIQTSMAEVREVRMVRAEELDSPTLGRDMAGSARMPVLAH
ncbi:MAG: hypothetical protein Q9227_006945 [Pyrenula ochraceoflavens]